MQARPLVALAVAATLAASSPAHASPRYAGTIVAPGSSTNNSTTATPFSLAAGARIAIQCDVSAYWLSGRGSATAVTAATGVKLEAGAYFEDTLQADHDHVAILPVLGTASCKVWTRSP